MAHRFSLLAGVVVFGVVLLRVAPANATSADAAVLRGAAAAGILLGAGITAAALRFRRPVGLVHLAVLSPVLAAVAVAILVEQTAVEGRAVDAVRVGVQSARTFVGGTRFDLEHAVVFAAAFWILAAFFIHATALGYPRLAAGPALAAALAVAVLERGEASLLRIAVDLGLVLLVLATASLDEDRRPLPRFRPAGRSSPRRRSWPRVLVFSVVAATAAGAVALSIGGTIAERPLEARSPLPARTFAYDPFVDIFSRLDEPTDLPLFAATISGEDAAATYWVFGRLTVFDGEGFSPGLGDEATFGAGPSITQEVVIDRLGGDWLPSVSGTTAASTGEIDGGNLVGEPRAGLRYVARSTGPVIPGVRDAVEVAPPHPITRATDGIDPAIAEEARRVVSEAGATTPLQQGAALETFLRGPTFSYAVNRYTSDLSDWLVDPTSQGYRSGYCEQFALSMAAMARTVGVPSRVVLGTAPGQQLADGSIVALDRSAHAWVELWIEGSGWVPFDPTPRNDGVALNPTTPLLPTDVLDAAPASEGVPEAAPLPSFTVGLPNGGPQPRRWLIGLAAIGAIALLAGSMLIRNRRRRTQARQGDVEAAWHEIITRLGELGAPPDPAMTPLELAVSTDAAMVPLAWAYTKSTYGGGVLTVAETRRAQDSLRRTDAAVTARTTRWRQISADIGLGRMATRRIRGS